MYQTQTTLLLSWLAISCATAELAPESPVSVKPVAPTGASLAPQAASLDEEARWLQLSFFYADNVLRVKVLKTLPDGAVEAEVLEQWRGYQNAKHAIFHGQLSTEIGSQWLVASSNLSGASPERIVFAALKDTEENIARAKAFFQPAWQRAPLVAIVKIIDPPKTTDYEQRTLFQVVEVLKGTIPKKLIDNDWSTILRREYTPLYPLTPNEQLYVLSAWGVEKNQYVPVDMPHISSLDPIESKDIPALKAALTKDLYSEERASLQEQEKSYNELYKAWTVHLAPYIALTQVTATYEEPTNCGGLHYLLSPVRWKRGATSEIPAKTLPETFSFGAAASPTPTLFYGGGHCHYGTERPGTQRLAAGYTLGGAPEVVMESTSANEALFDLWMNAPEPLFTAQDPSLSTYTAMKEGASALVPALPTLLPQGSWIRFQVTERTEKDGEVLLRCQEITSSGSKMPAVFGSKTPAEWVFYGDNLPSWEVGTKRWGLYITRNTNRDEALFKSSYFLPDFFLPAEDEQALHRLLIAAYYLTGWQSPRR